MTLSISVSIDRGGTFTDCIAHVSRDDGTVDIIEYKLLSEDPQNYPDAPREGIRRILEMVTKQNFPQSEPIDTTLLKSIRMSTTVATNALLERKGDKFAFLVTKGFKDLLKIGNQARPHLFDLSINTAKVLYDHVIEIDERVTLVGYSSCGYVSMEKMVREAKAKDESVIQGVTGESVRIMKPLDIPLVREQLQSILNKGIRNIAVCLLHSFTYPDHEKQIGKLAIEMGFKQVTLSSSIIPMIKMVPRASSACIDSYLTPCIQRYILEFSAGFDADLFKNVSILFMQSGGGLVNVERFKGFKAILSGPAGGVVGYSKTSYDHKTKVPLIGFDMGGTSTDVSRFSGHFEHVLESTTAGISVHVPQLDINTVAAGGGSRLFYRHGLLHVGPESAGAHPGPACYRKGGPLAITDANLILGRIIPEYFPMIFGAEENEALDREASRGLFQLIIDEENLHPKTVEELAFGFIQVSNESMCRPIRELTQAKGYDTKKHMLVCFGGAGGQHACSIAKILGIKRVFIHKYASVLSAYGLSLADVVSEQQEPISVIYHNDSQVLIMEKFQKLFDINKAQLLKQGFSLNQIEHEFYLNLRYEGSDCSLMVMASEMDGDFKEIFLQNYRREFGFVLDNRAICVEDVRVRSIGKNLELLNTEDLDIFVEDVDPTKVACHFTQTYFNNGWEKTPVYRLEDIAGGSGVVGPAILLNQNNTILVEPGCRAKITLNKNIVIDIISSSKPIEDATKNTIKKDSIQLSIFGHRFMSIAEQMGRVLQRTSVSTNIKERLDFSCALFAADGGLVANAPHIPVHLGSMQDAVRFQLKYNQGNIEDGDVFVTNHPSAGGSHLPDITVITPVFHQNQIVFFVASRGHHADIGGIAPGSMPPGSHFLYEEGAMIKSFKLVKHGKFMEEGMRKILLEDPAKYPCCTGTRNLADNISDLKAQVAANNQGIQLVKALVEEYSLECVLAYMNFIRENAKAAVSNLLINMADRHGNRLEAKDYLDDGSVIQLCIEINPKDGMALFDFTGTSSQVYGNLNAPKSVTYSAVIYCLRCLVGQDIPLNEGCLGPVQIRIPQGSILCPEEGRAVVGGNVLTSQRVVDVILKAFKACAASQGCMNNLTFGMSPEGDKSGWGYYETIAGGSGAGPGWNGTDGVHTHMTNTRITDPEILERRYPVILKQFSIREGSGGQGEYLGGNGIVREFEFLESMHVSILSERRVFSPYGLLGGTDGVKGENHLVSRGQRVNLGGKCTVKVEIGDILEIKTPGGGGYGSRI